MGALLAPLQTYMVWIRLAMYAACFLGGVYCTHKWYQAETVIQVNEARVTERDAVSIGNAHETGYLERMRKKQETANAKLTALQKALNAWPRCDVLVPTDWLQQPGGQVPAVAGDAAGTGSAGASVEAFAKADCRDVVATCEDNRLNICGPNADQLDETRLWYRDLRKRFNK